MTTENNNGLNACSLICWVLAAIAAAFIGSKLAQGMGMIVAVLIGLIIFLLLGWALRKLFCNKAAETSVMAAPATTGASASVASTAPTAPVATAKPKAAAPKSTATAKAKVSAKPAAAKKTVTVKTVATTTKKPAAKAPAAKKPAAKTSKATTAKTAAKKPATKNAAAPKVAAKKPAAKKAAAKKTPVLYTKRPTEVDDLKLISGVGPVFEKSCNDAGVYQFAQIANWKKADIQAVDAKLSVKGRIERDEWVKQAKILAKGGETAFSKKNKK